MPSSNKNTQSYSSSTVHLTFRFKSCLRTVKVSGRKLLSPAFVSQRAQELFCTNYTGSRLKCVQLKTKHLNPSIGCAKCKVPKKDAHSYTQPAQPFIIPALNFKRSASNG